MHPHRTLLLALSSLTAGLPFGSVAATTSSLIVLADDASNARSAVESNGGTVTFDLPIVNGVAALAPLDAIDDITRSAGVRSVTEDAPVTVAGQIVPSTLHEPSAVYPRAIKANKLWNEGIRGAGVTVAVVDTGIADVADLQGRLIGGIDFTPEQDPFLDAFGHGTFIAGMVAGNGASSNGAYKGVAPEASLVSVKIADSSGASDVSHVLAAMQWVVSFKDTYGIRVVNLSLGTDSSQSYRYSPLNYAVERAWDAGLVIVVSSSNSGPDPRTVAKPGDDPLVITVGASDDMTTAKLSDDVMAGFSGAGPTLADGLTKPDLVAPGRSVISLRAPGSTIDTEYPASRVGTGYFKGSGTSFSTAATSGAVALMLQREPALNPDQVKHRLMSTAAPGPAGQPNVDGAGALDIDAASHSLSLLRANTGVTRSLGTGSLALDRGSLTVSIDTELGLVLLNDAVAATGDLFDGIAYLTGVWAGDTWDDSQWAGTRWYGTRWYGTRWYGTRWYGTRWYSTDWYGSRWYGTAWE